MGDPYGELPPEPGSGCELRAQNKAAPKAVTKIAALKAAALRVALNNEKAATEKAAPKTQKVTAKKAAKPSPKVCRHGLCRRSPTDASLARCRDSLVDCKSSAGSGAHGDPPRLR